MTPWQLGMQGNAAMYSNAHVWMQTFDSCCSYCHGHGSELHSSHDLLKLLRVTCPKTFRD